jgi:chloramphenicol O-acetyltransferase type A
MHYINPNKWKRKKHFAFFRKFDWPHFTICSDVNITSTYRLMREKRISINTAVLFAVMKTCNSIEEFRYRIKGNRIKVLDIVHAGTTVLADEDVYSNCIIPYSESFTVFSMSYNEVSASVKNNIVLDEDDKKRDDLIYTSSLPWISFTHASNPMKINPADSIPRIIWGKQYRRDSKIMMPFSVQVNHCLMDGVHIGKFFCKLEELFKNPDTLFSR